ncbi:MAG: tetratricopeptide repeat protein [Brooklawnia sp.]|jgi:putative thioredoxin
MSSDQNFSRPGAVDLSGLSVAAPGAGAATSGGYVIQVDEASFESVAQQSVRYPVVLLLTSGGDAGSAGVQRDLTELVNAAAGRLLLGIVDVDTDARIAQALGVQAVPTAIALIAGQMAPLFQGTRDRADISAVLDQVMQIAVANGLTGRATPQAGAPADNDVQAPAEPALDPRFAAADEALQAGDFEQAVEEFDKLLKTNPRDSEAQAGRAQAALLVRTTELDPQVIAKADADPDDIDAQFAAADFELISNDADAAFTRLVSLVGRTTDDDRERVRIRLVELFDTVDPADPAVKKGRRALAMALF